MMVVGRRFILCGVLTIFMLSPASAKDPGATLIVKESWSGVFGGRQQIFHIEVSSEDAIAGRVGWSYQVESRVLRRAEVAVKLDAGAVQVIEVALDVAEVKPGVIVESALQASLFVKGHADALATFEKPIRVFSTDPFMGRTKWLNDLNIQLFDPEESTADVFDQAKVSVSVVHSVDALSGIEDGMLVVGEGVSLFDYRGLSKEMINLAARGVPVLCLAPSEGEMTLPGVGSSELPMPRGMLFRSNDMITELDKRLDAAVWPPGGRIKAGMFALRGARGPVTGVLGDESGGWPWVEMFFEADRTPTHP